MPGRCPRLVLPLLFWLLHAAPAMADTLAVVTSYPATFTEPFKQAFEARNPDIRLSFVHRNTASALRFVLERQQAPADLFWASSPDAFERLKARGALRPVPGMASDIRAPGGYPVDDPDDYFFGFSLARYGVVYDPIALQQAGLTLPMRWTDLLEPGFAGQIGMATPVRSGTTHLMIELILQQYGWDRGWAILSRLGGNLSTVTARSFGVASGVAQRRFGIGLSIDFLAELPRNSMSIPHFRPLEPELVVPASIGIVSRSGNPGDAHRFIEFVLSLDGQRLLTSSAIARTPVHPALNGDIGGGLAGPSFDSALSARRYEVVNLLFDEQVVRRRRALARIWRVLDAMEPGPQADAVRGLVEAPAISQAEALTLAESHEAWQPAIARTPGQNATVDGMRRRLDGNLGEAERLLQTRRSRP